MSIVESPVEKLNGYTLLTLPVCSSIVYDSNFKLYEYWIPFKASPYSFLNSSVSKYCLNDVKLLTVVWDINVPTLPNIVDWVTLSSFGYFSSSSEAVGTKIEA